MAPPTMAGVAAGKLALAGVICLCQSSDQKKKVFFLSEL